MAAPDVASCTDEEFDRYIDSLDLEELVEIISTIQDAMSIEQEHFDKISHKLSNITEDDLHQYGTLTEQLSASQTQLNNLMERANLCFEAQSIKAREEEEQPAPILPNSEPPPALITFDQYDDPTEDSTFRISQFEPIPDTAPGLNQFETIPDEDESKFEITPDVDVPRSNISKKETKTAPQVNENVKKLDSLKNRNVKKDTVTFSMLNIDAAPPVKNHDEVDNSKLSSQSVKSEPVTIKTEPKVVNNVSTVPVNNAPVVNSTSKPESREENVVNNKAPVPHRVAPSPPKVAPSAPNSVPEKQPKSVSPTAVNNTSSNDILDSKNKNAQNANTNEAQSRVTKTLVVDTQPVQRNNSSPNQTPSPKPSIPDKPPTLFPWKGPVQGQQKNNAPAKPTTIGHAKTVNDSQPKAKSIQIGQVRAVETKPVENGDYVSEHKKAPQIVDSKLHNEKVSPKVAPQVAYPVKKQEEVVPKPVQNYSNKPSSNKSSPPPAANGYNKDPENEQDEMPAISVSQQRKMFENNVGSSSSNNSYKKTWSTKYGNANTKAPAPREPPMNKAPLKSSLKQPAPGAPKSQTQSNGVVSSSGKITLSSSANNIPPQQQKVPPQQHKVPPQPQKVPPQQNIAHKNLQNSQPPVNRQPAVNSQSAVNSQPIKPADDKKVTFASGKGMHRAPLNASQNDISSQNRFLPKHKPEDEIVPPASTIAAAMTQDSQGFTTDDKIEDRVTLIDWDPTPLLKDLYQITLHPDSQENHTFYNMEGYMEKLPMNKRKGTLFKTWKRRFFRAKDGTLFYFESRPKNSDEETKNLQLYENSGVDKANGYLPLMGGNIENLGENTIGVDDGRGRYLIVRCPTADEFNKWTTALNSQTVNNVKSTWVKPVLLAPPSSKKRVVVIDLGSCSVRAGLLGDTASLPKLFFPCVVATPKQGGERKYGFDALKPAVRASHTINYPVRPTVRVDKFTVDLEAMHGLFKKIFKDLGVLPRDYSIMVSAPANFSDKIKEHLMNILINQFHVPGVNIVNQTLLALYSYNATSGIVVDIGERLEIVPVTDGYIVEGGVTRQAYGGQKIMETLNTSFTERRYRFFTDVEMQIVRAAMENLCFVSHDYEDELRRFTACAEDYKKSLDLQKYNLPQGSWTQVSNDLGRFKSAEGLFNMEVWGMDNPSLQKLIQMAVQASPMDTRRGMWRSIFLSGGVTMIPGFVMRLQAELKKLVPESITIEVHASPQRYHSAYIGACTLANMTAFNNSCITAKEWKQHGAKILRKWHMY